MSGKENGRDGDGGRRRRRLKAFSIGLSCLG